MKSIYNHIIHLRTPLYGVAFFILVAFLSSSFSSWGMEGIFFAVLVAAVVIGASSAGIKMVFQQTAAMLDGKPNELDHFVSPSGYRRRRYAETREEYAAQSVVVPTPNRPILPESERVVDATPSRALVRGTPRALAPHRLKERKQSLRACLELAPNFNPPHDQVLGRAILGVGQRGSGKTNTAALLIEQIGKFPIPMAIFDYEEDYTTLPTVLQRCVIAGSPSWSEAWRYHDHYWQVTEEDALEVGYEILEQGVQLVLQIGSYETLEAAAHIMTDIIRGMFAWADERAPKLRVPALVLLDEAQHFLPENTGVSHIQKEAAGELLKAFMDLNARGRKRGLTPVIFTQRIQQIKKAVIAGSEIFFLMRQTTPGDLDLYEEILGKKHLDRAQVTAFQRGDAIVFEGGMSFLVHFDERQSEHRGHTPDLENALNRYQARPLIQRTRIPAHVPSDEEAGEVDTEDLPAQEPPVIPKVRPKTDLEKVLEVVTENPLLTYREIGEKVGFGKDKVGELLKEAKERGLLRTE